MKNKTNIKKLSISDIVLCALFTALIAAGTYIRIDLPTVPLTMQTMFTNLAALLLGRKLAPLSVAAYVVLGLFGVPVFTRGGGFSYVLSPTFGYCIGFIIGAFTAGYIADKSKTKSFKILFAASLVNLVIIYLCGAGYYCLIKSLYLSESVSVSGLLYTFMLLPLPGDIIKYAAGSMLAVKLIPVLNRVRKPV